MRQNNDRADDRCQDIIRLNALNKLRLAKPQRNSGRAENSSLFKAVQSVLAVLNSGPFPPVRGRFQYAFRPGIAKQ